MFEPTQVSGLCNGLHQGLRRCIMCATLAFMVPHCLVPITAKTPFYFYLAADPHDALTMLGLSR